MIRGSVFIAENVTVTKMWRFVEGVSQILAKEKLKVRLRQEPLPTKKNINRRLFLCQPRSPHPKKLHQGAKYFVKSAKQHLKQTKR